LKLFVGRVGFEPTKSKDSGVTVRPVWPLWNLPKCICNASANIALFLYCAKVFEIKF
jgi:hypothetical protein